MKRSGGYAGVESEPVHVDADRLDPALRERLPSLLAAPAPEVVGADLPRYELSVDDGPPIVWHDDGSDAVAELRALAEEVERAGAT